MMGSRRRNLMAGLLVAWGASAHGAGLVLLEAPKNLQLYPRGENGSATVRARGTILVPGFDAVLAEAFRDGERVASIQQALRYHDGRAPFDLRHEIEAGLHSHDYSLSLLRGEERIPLGERSDVVCGDVLLIQGQSNAAAGDSHGEGLANRYQRPWIRSFGTPSVYPGEVRADTAWCLADGESWPVSGAVGAWGLRMAQLLMEAEGVPVAVLNGAVGATPIGWHLRDDAAPENLATIYGRLLWRARRARLAAAARAIFWYQGETNGTGNIRVYGEKFQDLHGDWHEDFPALEHTYVIQFRAGCGGTPEETIPMRGLQGRAADYFDDVETMSTTALHRHDGCHYYFTGYRELGERMARLVSRDLYGGTETEAISAPRLVEVRQDRAREVRLVFPPEHRMRWDEGAGADFRVEGGAQVVGGRAEGNEIVLELDAPRAVETVTYLGHPFDGPWVVNQRGIGILTFDRVAVSGLR